MRSFPLFITVLSTLLEVSIASEPFPKERWGLAEEQIDRLGSLNIIGKFVRQDREASSSTASESCYEKGKEKTYREHLSEVHQIKNHYEVERKIQRDYCFLHGLPPPTVSSTSKLEEAEKIDRLEADLAQHYREKVLQTESRYPSKIEYKVGTPKLQLFQKYREEPLEAHDFGKPERNWTAYYSNDQVETMENNYFAQVCDTDYPYSTGSLATLGNQELGAALLSEDQDLHYHAVNHLIKLQSLAAKAKRRSKEAV